MSESGLLTVRLARIVRRRSVPIGAGTILALVLTLGFVAIWGRVLTGDRALVGGDVLYALPPWSGAAGAHPAANIIVLDAIDQFLPWLEQTARAFSAGWIPLWDSMAGAGTPILANDQSAPFSPFTWIAMLVGGVHGYSIAMLAKLWVAGVGMLIYLRVVGARPLAAGMGGVIYATSSFMVVWLSWPQTAVAALLPWLFASVEWYLRKRSMPRLVLIGVAVCLQFLAGHAETSLHLGVGAAIYSLVRCVVDRRGLRDVAGLVGGAALGAAAASIQLIPFADVLRQSTLFGDRQASGAGLGHLPVQYLLLTWLAPNLHGNPGIDGSIGWQPNYNEATGFAGVGAVGLAIVGAVWGWGRTRVVMLSLLSVGLFAAGTVYGILTPLVGRLPGLATSNNARFLVLIGFAVAGLAGLGMEALLSRPARSRFAGDLLAAIGLAGLGTVLVLGITFIQRRAAVDSLLPQLPHDYIGFWAAFAAASVTAAGSLCLAGWVRGGRLVCASLVSLVLVEAATFAGAFEPQVSPSVVPPHSTAVAWLQAHAGGARVTATGPSLLPETATLYGLADLRSYDTVRPPRLRVFLSRADPAYSDAALITILGQPRADWLAAAGVAFVMVAGDQALPGTEAVFRGEGVTIGSVPGVRSLAFAASTTACARGPEQAADMMTSRGALGPVVLETRDCPAASPADVRIVTRPAPEDMRIAVTAARATVVVVLQTYTSDWSAAVDGRRTAIMPADVLFQAIAVPAGRHIVDLSYRPASVGIGALVSALAVMAMLSAGAVGVWRGSVARSSQARRLGTNVR